MKLLFDQNLSYKLGARLEDTFPGSRHVREVGLDTTDDLGIWEHAKASSLPSGMERKRGSVHESMTEGDEMVNLALLEQDLRLAEVVRRLVAAYKPQRIYLFGSVARGDAGPDSDYDLMLIVPDDAPPDRRRSRLAYQALRGTGIAADVLVSTRSQFERRAHVVSSLPATVLREGKVLHAA